MTAPRRPRRLPVTPEDELALAALCAARPDIKPDAWRARWTADRGLLLLDRDGVRRLVATAVGQPSA